MNQINSDNNNIYYIETEQKMALEKEISKSLITLKNLFQKDEILKFLFKSIDEGKYDFNEENQNKESPLNDEEISKKKDEFCREIKEMFDQIDPQIFPKYNNRIANATIRIMTEINKRKVKIKRINLDSNENKLKYNKLDQLKSLIKETIYISTFYNNELVNINDSFLQKLDEFYNDKSNIELINRINGEEKKCKDDDLIRRVVNTKENLGKQYIIDTKNYIRETTKVQIDLNNKISKEMNEIINLKDQQLIFDEYCNSKNNYFKDINEFDFY